jgi:signal transduction histidine kinase
VRELSVRIGGWARRHPRLLWVLFAGALLAAVQLNTHALLEGAVQELPANLDVGLDVTQADIASWRATRLSQAQMLARLFADTALGERSSASSRGGAAGPAQRYGSFLDVVARADGYAVIRVFDERGALRGATGAAREHLAAPRDLDLLLRDERLVARTAPPEESGEQPALEFLAVARPAEGNRRDATLVVLRARPNDSTFGNLNPTRTSNRTARTSLLVRRGDSVDVVATRSHSGVTGLRRRFSLSEAPPYVAAVLEGRRQRGVGRGLFGDDVAYAAQPTLAPQWALIREMETEEYRSRLRLPVLAQSLVLGALACLAVLVIVNRVRAAAAARARELARLRTDFVASASHELRTPLAQIRLFSDLLRRGALPDPEDTDRALRVIASESQRLAALVDNLLNFASVRRSAQEGRDQTCLLSEETEQVVADFLPLARERNVAIETDITAGLVAPISPEAYRQVLINLLDNALKYGGSDQTISVRLRQRARTVTLSVEDSGPGVPSSERARVWQAFYRDATAAAAGTPGSGIGLAVVRDLVLEAGGSARVEDGARRGAHFVVELPANERAT